MLKARAPAESAAPGVLASGAVDLIDSSPYSKEQPLTAQLAVNQKITGRASDKDVRHIEIDLGDSGLRYQPGDALGVWFDNDPALVDELVQLLWLKGDEPVEVEGQTLPLAQALRSHFELTQNTTPIVDKYAALSRDETLIGLLADKAALQRYAHNTPIVDMVRQAPADLSAEQLVGLLRPLTPRLYSIASSQAENESEVHITVGVVRYDIDGRARSGGASGFGGSPGGRRRRAGVYRTQRQLPPAGQSGSAGDHDRSGHRHRAVPRLYAAARRRRRRRQELAVLWQPALYRRFPVSGRMAALRERWPADPHRSGRSRDQQHKIYVQDKLREQGAEVWRWIQEGAHIYVCGDANRMAKDVENTLLELVAEHGGMDTEQADEFLVSCALSAVISEMFTDE